MTLWKRRYADSPIRRHVSPSRRLYDDVEGVRDDEHLRLWFRCGGSPLKVSFDAPRFRDIAFAPQILVRWLSGRKRRFAKALYLKRVPRVRIPASPVLSDPIRTNPAAYQTGNKDSVALEVLFPLVQPRIKESDERTAFRVKCAEVRSFVCIAVVTGESEIFVVVTSANAGERRCVRRDRRRMALRLASPLHLRVGTKTQQ